MSNSEPHPFEELLTRYIDGKLPPSERMAFEKEHPEVVAEKITARNLAEALRKNSDAPHLHNPEFFNHQIMREIQPPHPVEPERGRSLFSPKWLLAGGLACFLVAFGVFQTFVSKTDVPDFHEAQVLTVTAGDPELTAKLIESEGLSVVWVEGMEYLPANYTLE